MRELIQASTRIIEYMTERDRVKAEILLPSGGAQAAQHIAPFRNLRKRSGSNQARRITGSAILFDGG
jgi:hypothetical protein